jgi:hypothetical protein
MDGADTGAATVLCDRCSDRRRHGPNDIMSDSDSGCDFSDPRKSRVCDCDMTESIACVRADGSAAG